VNWTLEETAARRNACILRKYKLAFLTSSFKPQSSAHLSLFYQITKVTKHPLKLFMCLSSALDVQFIKFKTKWKGHHNPQTCYWIRASLTAQSQGFLFTFFSSLAFEKCFFPYCSFVEEAMKDRELSHQKLQPYAVCFQFSGKLIQFTVSLVNFWEMLLPITIIIFVCCQLDI